MAGKLEQSWDLIADHLRPLSIAVCLVYMPYYLLYKGTVALAWLPDEAADKLFGLVGVFLGPLANAMVVALVDGWRRGLSPTLATAVAAAGRCWTRLLVSYVSVTFILLGWLTVTVLPCYIALMIAGIQKPLYLVPVAAVTAALVMSRYVFLDALVVVAGLSPWQARQKSAELAKGRRLRVLGLCLLTAGPPLALDAGSDWLEGQLKPWLGPWSMPFGVGLGLASSLLYVLPLVFFYIYYRELTDAGDLAKPETPRSPRPSTGG